MNLPIEYRGYTIQEDYRNPYNKEPEFMYYPTAEGIQHDADGDSEGYRYCGNCRWAATLEDAKDEIMEKIAMSMPDHEVQVQSGKVEKFSYFSQAVRAAIQSNGILLTPINSI